MILLSQIKQADRIAALSEYYALSIRAGGPDAAEDHISSVSVLKVSDRKVQNEAFLRISSDENAYPDEVSYSVEVVADSISKLLLGSVVAAEPETVVLLRSLLSIYDSDGEIQFLPACRLASALFPSISGENVEETAEELAIPITDFPPNLQEAYLEANILERCRIALSKADSNQSSVPAVLVQPYQKPKKTHQKHSSGKKARSVSDDTLSNLAKSAWTASPWVFGVLAIILLILAAILIPHAGEKKVDRNVAPVSYLVLSWDNPGKYGIEQKVRAGEENPIQFRIPYGVYNVLNNNSIPVELHVINENDDKTEKEEMADDTAAAELNASEPTNEEEEPSNSRVIIRPNSSRQITIDTDQYLTLSEEAKDLIFFYLSAVPEEPESDTTGQVQAGQSVIYAYVKGSEVRFRRAPSLEGQIIDTLNNGQQVQVLAISGEWTHVQVRDQKGYIFSQYLTSDDPTQRAGSGTVPESSDTENNTSELPENPQPAPADTAAAPAVPSEPAELDAPMEKTPESAAEPVSPGS